MLLSTFLEKLFALKRIAKLLNGQDHKPNHLPGKAIEKISLRND